MQRYIDKITRLPVIIALTFGLVGGAVFALILVQADQVVSGEGHKQAEKQVRQLSAMAADLIQQRTLTEMRDQEFTGLPSREVISRHSNAAVQNFPGQIVLMEEGRSEVLFTTFTKSRLDQFFGEILANRSKDRFMLGNGDSSYVTYKQPLIFSEQNKALEGFFMARESVLMAPYEKVSARLWFYSIVGLVLLIAAGALLGKFLSVRLNAIRQVVVDAEKGEKPEPLSELGTKEFNDLASALNLLIQGPSAKDKVRQEANTDALTGLLNRRGFVQAMDDKFSKGGGSAEMSVMFMDLDGFKPINDTYGHDVGDDILKEVAKRLSTCTREQDIICRLGGDEFVLLFPGLTDRKVLEQRADRVLAQINDPYWVEDNRVTMGVSIGISIGPADGKTGEELLSAADEAMYAAKKTGKNQCTFYS